MSTTVMAACWPIQTSPKAKAVLISLADNANDFGECFPSIAFIAKRTCMSTASVIRAIHELEMAGHVVTDRSNGRHSRYIVTPKLDLFEAANQLQGATGSKVQPVANGASKPANQLQGATGPVAGCNTNRQVTVTKSKSNHQRAGLVENESAGDLPAWLPPDAWKDWNDYRTSRKGWTAKARALSLRTLTRLHEAGEDPRAVIEQAIERGWTGLFPVRSAPAHGPPSRPSIAQQFAQKTYTGTPDDDLPEFLRTGTH